MIRFYMAYFFANLGRFLQGLSPVILRPEQMMAIRKTDYALKHAIERWTTLAEKGLRPVEQSLVERFTNRKGKFLVLESSSGREALPLAKMGFEVTGVEWVEALIGVARERAKACGANIRYLKGDILQLEKLNGSFDYIMLGAGDYSVILSRRSRVAWLGKLKRLLHEKGRVFLSCVIDHPSTLDRKLYRLKKAIAFCTWGNREYQLGDRPLTNRNVLHYFADVDEATREAREAGYRVLHTAQEGLMEVWFVLERDQDRSMTEP